MNREIKFRAKSIETNEFVEKDEWVYGYYAYLNQQTTIFAKFEVESGGLGSGLIQTPIRVIFNTVSEFTGLKDKNGKEIYEGDILRGDARKWDEYIIEIEDIAQAYWYMYNDQMHLDFSKDFEVIGNVYENPELI